MSLSFGGADARVRGRPSDVIEDGTAGLGRPARTRGSALSAIHVREWETNGPLGHEAKTHPEREGKE